jgi:hypothetical protein
MQCVQDVRKSSRVMCEHIPSTKTITAMVLHSHWSMAQLAKHTAHITHHTQDWSPESREDIAFCSVKSHEAKIISVRVCLSVCLSVCACLLSRYFIIKFVIITVLCCGRMLCQTRNTSQLLTCRAFQVLSFDWLILFACDSVPQSMFL